MTIRAVIFDIYGTLLQVGPPPVDAEAQWQRLGRELLGQEPALSRLGFAVACSRVIARHHEAARARGIAWPEVHWPSVVAEVLPAVAGLTPEKQEEFLFRHIQTGHTTRLRVEAAATLRWLKDRRCLLGLASNAQAYTLRELRQALAGHGLDLELFEPDLCFWSFEHGFSKPDPHVFQILTIRLAARGVRPPEILMVGDRLDTDIQPARAAGWQTWPMVTDTPGQGNGGWAALRQRLQACGPTPPTG